MKLNIFFWNKKKQSFSDKIKEALPLLIELLPQLRAAMRGNVDPTVSDGKIIGQMYDFVKNFDNTVRSADDDWIALPPELENKKGNRIAIKPKEVESELETIPTPWTIDNLEQKISLLKDKTLLSNQRYVSDQLQGIIKRLENRRNYKEHREFFESFPNTTDEKIDQLLSKYKLVLHSSELFVPTFPKEAIDVMKKYSEITQKVSSEKPVFYVIAEEKDFKEKNKKLDPILLAQSPFGFYWQILGAWDKEMLLLSEL
jgi:hypothetical protein